MVPFLRQSGRLASILAVFLAATSCGGGEDPPTGVDTTGTINVTVRADGSPKADVIVQRFSPGGSTPAAAVSTNASGVASFNNVEEGTWEVEVVLPDDFELDAGEDARKSVSVTAGQTATSSFDLVDTFQGETVEARDDLTFSVDDLQITAGTAVRWVNVGQMLHTVTPQGHTEWSAANLSSNGSTFVHTFDTPGTYAYYCQPHLGQGMTGTVTVN